MTDTKTYFAYTPQDFKTYFIGDSRKPGQMESKVVPYGDRATIAVRIINDHIVYGVSICDQEDKFNKVYGRFIAQERMLLGFGSIPISNFKFKGAKTSEGLALYFLNNLTESVYTNIGKYKQKIGDFKKNKKGPKVLVGELNKESEVS